MIPPHILGPVIHLRVGYLRISLDPYNLSDLEFQSFAARVRRGASLDFSLITFRDSRRFLTIFTAASQSEEILVVI